MFKELFDYTFWADKLAIRAFEQAPGPLPEAERLFSHILNAQHIWLSRILNKQALYERFQVHAKELFAGIQQDNEIQFRAILKNDTFERPVYYSTSQGDEYINVLSDILFHVVNHSTYHRGQVMTQFRLSGMTPPATDYIMFRRDGKL